MSQYETVDRIRRSHRAARPNPAANPAWANCHMDCGILLAEIDRLRASLHDIANRSECPAVTYRHMAAQALLPEEPAFKKCPNCDSAYGDLARCACGQSPDNQESKP